MCTVSTYKPYKVHLSIPTCEQKHSINVELMIGYLVQSLNYISNKVEHGRKKPKYRALGYKIATTGATLSMM
ncbi:hypothetical protein AYI70_g3660 [Smittium culicis]|uniref:Uncharacterized protein n=1 Tax=Smittium culicis TaxID=133412 RepID=A0A1R1Y2D5_9FUNG|nr:hypothetical protein AYI70_g3660 [Smittium culicis]